MELASGISSSVLAIGMLQRGYAHRIHVYYLENHRGVSLGHFKWWFSRGNPLQLPIVLDIQGKMFNQHVGIFSFGKYFSQSGYMLVANTPVLTNFYSLMLQSLLQVVLARGFRFRVPKQSKHLVTQRV